MHGTWQRVIASLSLLDEWHVGFLSERDYNAIRYGVRAASYRMGIRVRIHRCNRRQMVVTKYATVWEAAK